MSPFKNIFLAPLLLSFVLLASAQDEETVPAKKGARISIQFNDNDSMHVVNATVTDSVTGMPLNKVELSFFIKRAFGFMQVGEAATTDSTGFATTEFKKDVRADINGKAVFFARIADNDEINDKDMQVVLKPDLPYVKSTLPERAMFARHAPWWLVITFTALVAVVWITYAYIIILVKKIRNAGKLIQQ